MSGLRYVGRNPDSDSSVLPKSFADADVSTLGVTTAFVNAAIAQKTQLMVLPSYVDTEDALLSHKTDVDAADTNYVPLTELGQADGVATLDSSGNVTSSQLPTVVTDRPAVYYNAATDGVIYLGSGSTHTVTTQSSREFKLASIVVADPGFPWYPVCFATVQGHAGGTDNGRSQGNGNYGQLVAQPPLGVSNTIYAAAIAASDVISNFYCLIPYVGTTLPAITPVSQPPIVGSLELDLFASCWSGTSYIWSGAGLMFQVIVTPAL